MCIPEDRQVHKPPNALSVFISVHLWLNFFVVSQVFFELRERRVKVFRDFDLAL